MKSLVKIGLLLLGLALATPGLAQYTSVRGFFDVNEINGCTGLNVAVSINPSAPFPCYDGNNSCTTFWGDGNQTQTSTPPSHTYNDFGEFWLKVSFQNDFGSDSIRITINESIPPDFILYACSGRNVAVDITDTDYDNYVINDGISETTVPQGAPDFVIDYSSFPVGSTQTVSVRGLDNNAADNCPDISDNINILNALPAGAIDALEVVSNNSVMLNYSLANSVLYELQVAANGSSNFSPIKTLTPDITSDTIAGLDLANNYFCFRVATINACVGSIDNLSTEVCTISSNLETLDDFNQLTWSTSNPDIDFDILRDDRTSPLVTVPAIRREYDDANILCQTEYCYTIVGNYNNGATSTSLPVCGTSFSTNPPDSIQNISTQIVDESITLIWEAPNTANQLTYSIYERNGGLRFIGTSDTTNYTINNVNVNTRHCYEIQSEDQCGNRTTASIVGCTILLSGSIDKQDNVTITWQQPSGWLNGIDRYTINKAYNNGSAGNIVSNDTTFSETDNSNNQVIFYTIVATPNDNLANSISNTIELIKPNNIYFPNAFTPDGDGRNETFKINGRFITSFDLKIFNRWGQLVYFTTNLEDSWDGTNDGKDLDQGTYAFRASIIDQAGRQIEKDGTITLLRK
ncbi:MAG: gliding motility-associated C-terminal domain-containing protein [Fulvivirga sp.]